MRNRERKHLNIADSKFLTGGEKFNFVGGYSLAVAIVKEFLPCVMRISRHVNRDTQVFGARVQPGNVVPVFVSNEYAVYGFRIDAVRSQLVQNCRTRDPAIYQQARVGEDSTVQFPRLPLASTVTETLVWGTLNTPLSEGGSQSRINRTSAKTQYTARKI